MRLQKIVMAGVLSIVLGAGATGCQSADTTSKENTSQETTTYQYTDFVMDTVLSETIYGAKEDCTKEVQNVLKELEEKELSWRLEDSEMAQMNNSLQKEKRYKMSEQMAEWMTVSLQLAKDSDGAFDPTIGALARLWDIEGDNPTVPEKTAIEKALTEVGYQDVTCDRDTIYIEGTRLMDLGAAGKGIACDKAYEYLSEETEVTGAVIAVGGSILTYGEKEDGSTWNVAIQDPEESDGTPMGVLHLTGTHYISTSGDYEKYFVQDGKRYHHILDAKTGYPTDNGLSSVTIICDNGLLSDGLSTACFILGKEKSEELLKQYNASAVFIDHDGNVELAGDEAKEAFELMNAKYKVK